MAAQPLQQQQQEQPQQRTSPAPSSAGFPTQTETLHSTRIASAAQTSGVGAKVAFKSTMARRSKAVPIASDAGKLTPLSTEATPIDGVEVTTKALPPKAKPRYRKVGARCRSAGCGGRPWFAVPGSKIPKACKDHREEGEVNIYAPACEAQGCKIRPHYGWEGTKAKFCCLHKLEGMIDVLNKRCNAPGCRRQPSWAGERGEKALFCKAHKEDNMVDTRHKTCLHPGCERFPSKSGPLPLPLSTASITNLAPPAATMAAKTRTNRNENDDVGGSACGGGDVDKPDRSGTMSTDSNDASEFCAKPFASSRDQVAVDGPGPARYCAAHAPTGSVNVVAVRCRHSGCSVQPSFGREGAGELAIFCARHRKQGMTDVRNPRCLAGGCVAQPRCGKEGDRRPTFCLRHAEPGMVNVRLPGYRDKLTTKKRKVVPKSTDTAENSE